MELTTAEAKESATDWVAKNASKIPSFLGAFFAGSINWSDDGVEWPKISDVDVFVIADNIGTYKIKHQKFVTTHPSPTSI